MGATSPFQLAAPFYEVKKKCLYMYDFMDDWDHIVMLEEIHPEVAEGEEVACLKGKRACPPENCGGIERYNHIVQVLDSGDEKAREEQLEQLGKVEFEPEAFNLRKANKRLKALLEPVPE